MAIEPGSYSNYENALVIGNSSTQPSRSVMLNMTSQSKDEPVPTSTHVNSDHDAVGMSTR